MKRSKYVLSIVLFLLTSCTTNLVEINSFEQKYDFDRVDRIKVATWFEEEESLIEIINAFHDRYPNVVVDLVLYPSQTYDDYIDEIVDESNHFDVILFPSGYSYASLVFSDQLMNISEDLSQDNVDLSVYGTLLNDLETDEGLYGLPYRNSVFLLYYNKTLFDKAGVDYPNKDMTWNMFLSKARALTQGEGQDKIWGAFIQSYVQLWTLSSLQDGKSLLDDDLSSFKDSMEFTLELVKNDLILSPLEIEARDYVQNGSIKFFGSGQVAMMPMGEWTAWQLLERDDIDFEWAVTEMPYPQGGRRNVTIGNVTIASILSHSSSKEMAYEFIKTLSGPSGAKIYASNKSIPAFINEEIRALYLKNTDPSLELHYFLEAQTESFAPIHKYSQELSELFTNTFEAVLNRELSTTEAMDIIYTQRVSILNP